MIAERCALTTKNAVNRHNRQIFIPMANVSEVLTIESLPSHWRAEAARLRHWCGDHDPVARALVTVAAQVEQVLATAADDLLTLGKAASESGYSVEHLGRMLREQPVLNAGRRGAPRIRRGNLPMKPGYSKPPTPTDEAASPPRRGVAHAILSSKYGGAR